MNVGCGDSDGKASDSGAEDVADDTDSTPDYTGISGVTNVTDNDCTVSAPFTGTPFTGDCDGCSFAFEVEAGEETWTAGGPSECSFADGLLVGGGNIDAIAHVPTFESYIGGFLGDDGYNGTATNVLLVSQFVDDSWYAVFSDGYNSLSWDGDNFTAEASWTSGYAAGVSWTINGTLTTD